MADLEQENVWIIQRCIDAFTNHYESWSGYCEIPMSRNEMIQALEECVRRWPNYRFRGHNIQFVSERHAFDEYPKPRAQQL